MNQPKGIILTGYPATGKSTVGYELTKYFQNSKLFDKSLYITHIPRILGLNNKKDLEQLTLKEFNKLILNFDVNLIKNDFIDSSTREETVNFSKLLREHFGQESGYNYLFLDELVKKSNFPIIAGPRYLETIEHFAEKGYAIYGLFLNDMNEMQKRIHMIMHNGSNWGSAEEQLKLEKEAFEIDPIIKYIESKKSNLFFNYDTAKMSPKQIAYDIFNKINEIK